ncbi:unnamed protein product [Lampetra fluviatilis]
MVQGFVFAFPVIFIVIAIIVAFILCCVCPCCPIYKRLQPTTQDYTAVQQGATAPATDVPVDPPPTAAAPPAQPVQPLPSSPPGGAFSPPAQPQPYPPGPPQAAYPSSPHAPYPSPQAPYPMPSYPASPNPPYPLAMPQPCLPGAHLQEGAYPAPPGFHVGPMPPRGPLFAPEGPPYPTGPSGYNAGRAVLFVGSVAFFED